MDQGVPGQYNASHAEKQAIVNNPGAAQVDVSRRHDRFMRTSTLGEFRYWIVCSLRYASP
ncbi:hypothetical protein [Ralstonia solanacearum]|uniref:hypothetical protein n=1 Tax=Ralstonia solanacearum TaxID=305 RepID=UPI003D683387